MDLFVVSRADIFGIYPQIFKELIQKAESKRTQDGFFFTDFIYLPSDPDFQENVYYRLLKVQKSINAMIDNGM